MSLGGIPSDFVIEAPTKQNDLPAPAQLVHTTKDLIPTELRE